MNVNYDNAMTVSLNIIREYGSIIGYDINDMEDEELFNHINENSTKKADVILEIAHSIRKLNIL